MYILILNSLLYFLAFIVLFQKSKNLTLYSYLFLLYAVIAFMGVITFSTGIYQNTFGYKDESSLSIIPYLLCFMVVYILLRPLQNINVYSYKFSLKKNVENYLIYGTFFIYIIYIVLYQKLISQRGMFLDFGEIYADAALGNVLTFNNPILDFIYSKILTLSRLLPYIIYPLLFVRLINKKNITLNMVLILALFIMQVYPLIFNANRGGLFFTTMMLISYYLFFRMQLSKNIKKAFYVFGGIISIILVSYILAISLSRAGDVREQYAVESMIYRYLGESFPNLGFNIWNAETINHPYGKRFFPSLFGTFDNYNLAAGRNASFDYWERFVGIPMLNFKTIFGDLYIEFGVVGGILFISIFSYLYKKFLLKRIYTLVDLSYLFYYINVCIWGLFNCYLAGEDTWKDLLYLFIIVSILNRYGIKKRRIRFM